MKKTLLFIIVLFIVFTITNNSYSADVKIEKLDDLINEALDNNPAVREAYNMWKAAEYKAKQALGFPDAKAYYGFFGESVETRVGPQKNKFGVSQKIPFPAKLGMKEIAESRNADMLKEKYEATRREVAKNVKFVYYDIYWVDKAIQITEEEKSILENLEKVAERRYESKLAPVQDPIKAQVELSRLIDKLFVLRQNRKSLAAKMISMLNRLQSPALNSIEEIEPLKFNYKLDELHYMASESRQELLAAQLEIERAEYEKSLAQFDYLPDITLGFDYIQVGNGHTNQPDDGKDAWMGSVAINVPIWFDRLDAKVKEKRASLESSRNRYRDIANSVYYEVEDMYYKILSYKDIISLYQTALLPQTEQSFEAARTGYETAEVDFLNWLDAERTLLQTRIAYYKAIVDYQKSIAYLERVVGRDL